MQREKSNRIKPFFQQQISKIKTFNFLLNPGDGPLSEHGERLRFRPENKNIVFVQCFKKTLQIGHARNEKKNSFPSSFH